MNEEIGVCCGHRVPRVPIAVPRTDGRGTQKVYWCAECNQHRMSGGKVTGERGFDWLLELRDEIELRQLTVVFPRRLSPEREALVRALGATPSYRT